jgi:hypothetical protein
VAGAVEMPLLISMPGTATHECRRCRPSGGQVCSDWQWAKELAGVVSMRWWHLCRTLQLLAWHARQISMPCVLRLLGV